MLTAKTTGSPPLEQVSGPPSRKRPTTGSTVALLVDDQRTCFCFVEDISPLGAQVRHYSKLKLNSPVRLTVGDELIDGHVSRVRGELAGITFSQPFDFTRLLRAAQEAAPARRRCSPRVNVAARAMLRTNTHILSCELSNLSSSGAKVVTTRRLSEGHRVSLVLPDLPAITASVCWSEEHGAGLVFRTPVPVQMLAPWLAGRLRVSV